MAAMVSITPTSVGALSAGTAVSASDTIAASLLGQNGCYLEVLNGGASPDVVAISDGGSTPAGTAGTSTGGSVTNATNKIFYIHPKQANLTTQLVTVTHTFTTTVTYKLYPLG